MPKMDRALFYKNSIFQITDASLHLTGYFLIDSLFRLIYAIFKKDGHKIYFDLENLVLWARILSLHSLTLEAFHKQSTVMPCSK